MEFYLRRQNKVITFRWPRPSRSRGGEIVVAAVSRRQIYKDTLMAGGLSTINVLSYVNQLSGTLRFIL